MKRCADHDRQQPGASILPSQPAGISANRFQKLIFTGDGISDDIVSKEIISMINQAQLSKKNNLFVMNASHTAMDRNARTLPGPVIHPNERGAGDGKAVYQSISCFQIKICYRSLSF